MDKNMDWLELAKEAAVTAADYHEQGNAYGNGKAKEWARIAHLRAQIAQAVALASIAESFTRIADAIESADARAETAAIWSVS